MKHIFEIARPFFLTISVLYLGACGGDSTNNDPPPNTNPVVPPPVIVTGQFILNLPVSGLRYETKTHSGLTNALGEFTFQEGEVIRFYIGSFLLASVNAKDTMTPFDLAKTFEPKTPAQAYDLVSFYPTISFPARHAINIAILLLTLDQDNNPANGIVIAPEVHDWFTNNKPTFSLRDRLPNDFVQKDFFNLVAKLNKTGFWATPLVIWSPGAAMQQMMNRLQPQLLLISKLTHVTLDDNNDGVPNYIGDQTYNANGQLLTLEIDRFGDGVLEENESHEYDANGNRTLDIYRTGTTVYRTNAYTHNASTLDILTETFSNNLLNYRTSHTFDSNYQKLKYELYKDNVFIERVYNDLAQRKVIIEDDNNGLQSGGIVKKHTYTYDENNNLLRYESDTDGDGPGTITYATYRTYDANSNEIKYEEDIDGDGPGTITNANYHTYDANNNETFYEVDGDGDGPGTITYRRESSYDGFGRIVRKEVDGNGDATGGINYIHTYVYDSNGNEILFENDTSGNGSIDSSYVRTFSSTSKILREEYYQSGRLSTLTTYAYDRDDNLIRQAYDINGDGTLEKLEIYSYDDQGRRTMSAIDSDGVGPSQMIRQFYDIEGNVVRHETDSNGESAGGVTRRAYTTYNSHNQILKYEIDKDGDGPQGIGYRDTYVYNANNDLVDVVRDYDGDETSAIGYHRTLEYDTFGNVTRVETDSDGDGAVNGVDLRTYSVFSLNWVNEMPSSPDFCPVEVVPSTIPKVDPENPLHSLCRVYRLQLDQTPPGFPAF